MPFRRKNNNNDNDKDNDSDNYNNNDYDNDNDKNNNENSNCGELCSQQTCLAQIGLEISPDVSRTFCLAFMPFIRTADHYQAGSNTSLRSLCEFFGLLFPFWSVISQAVCACSQVRENLEVFCNVSRVSENVFMPNDNTRPSWTECDFNFIRTFQSQRAHVRFRL